MLETFYLITVVICVVSLTYLRIKNFGSINVADFIGAILVPSLLPLANIIALLMIICRLNDDKISKFLNKKIGE